MPYSRPSSAIVGPSIQERFFRLYFEQLAHTQVMRRKPIIYYNFSLFFLLFFLYVLSCWDSYHYKKVAWGLAPFRIGLVLSICHCRAAAQYVDRHHLSPIRPRCRPSKRPRPNWPNCSHDWLSCLFLFLIIPSSYLLSCNKPTSSMSTAYYKAQGSSGETKSVCSHSLPFLYYIMVSELHMRKS